MRNYFDLFDFEVKFNINLDILEKKYLELQKKYHPDNFVADTSKKKIEFFDNTGEINKGYQIIKDDLKRAIHILELKNINFQDCTIKKNDLEIIWGEYNLAEKMNNEKELQAKLIQKLDDKKNIISKLSNAFKVQNYNLASYYTVILKYLENLIIFLNQKCKS